ncbi:MAG TPA: hypothetical protein DCM05_03410 [Elusimicrobia bacterium]|nr:hypothetical protein [Elusimicrobiota bacterium]
MRSALLVLLLALPAPAGAFTGNTGGSTAQFLRIGAGARALGLGEAFGPVAEGPDSMYWNPAGLASQRRPEVSYSHVEMMQFFHHDYLAYAHPVKLLRGGVGAAMTMYYEDSLDLVSNANEVQGRFRPHAESIALGYGRSFLVGEDVEAVDRSYFQDKWDKARDLQPLDHRDELWTGKLDAGLSMKYLQQSLYDRSASAVAFDGGVLFQQKDVQRLTLSFGFKNVGTAMKFINDSENLPSELDLGAALDLPLEHNRRALFAFETAFPYYGAPHAKLGAEYTAGFVGGSMAAFRLGYKTLSAPDLGVLSGLTCGVGLLHGGVRFDVGFQPMDALGNVFRFSLGYRF